MAIKKNRVPVRSQLPEERITNFDEVCFGYNASEAIQEAERCIQCKNPRCVQACPRLYQNTAVHKSSGRKSFW